MAAHYFILLLSAVPHIKILFNHKCIRPYLMTRVCTTRVGRPRAVKSKPPLAERKTMKDQGKIKNDEIKVHRYPPSPSAPSLSSSSLNNAICSSRSLFSHSEASLAAPSPSSATGGSDVLPTSVVARKTKTAWLHRSSASSSAILVRSRPRELSGLF